MAGNNLRWADQYPELGIDPIPVDGFTSPEQYRLERDKVFKEAWLLVGREEELPAAGSYKIKRIDAAKASIILFRGRDGQVRGFHNVCSHRANKMLAERGEETFGRNPAATMFCAFHGWVYDGKGALVSVPQEEKFKGCLERDKAGLTSVHVGTWKGFLFVNLAKEPRQALEDNMREIGEHFGDYPFGEMTYQYSYSAVLDANWKVALDAFSEVYHLGILHSRTLPGSFADGLEDAKLLGDHRTFGLHLDLTNAKFTPLQEVSNSLATVSLMVAKSGTMLPPAINPKRSPSFGFEISPIFPNSIIHVADGLWFTHQFWPQGHNKVLWEGKYYVQKPETNSQLWAAHHAQTITRNVWLEDAGTIEATQEGLESGAKLTIILQDDEIMLRHSNHVIEKYIHA